MRISSESYGELMTKYLMAASRTTTIGQRPTPALSSRLEQFSHENDITTVLPQLL